MTKQDYEEALIRVSSKPPYDDCKISLQLHRPVVSFLVFVPHGSELVAFESSLRFERDEFYRGKQEMLSLVQSHIMAEIDKVREVLPR